MLSNSLFSKLKNVGNAKCRPTIDGVSTNYWPIHRSSIDQPSTNYRRSVGEMSAKCRRKVGEVSVKEKVYRPRHVWNDYRPRLDRVSTHYRPTIDRYIDRVSTECRPLYRPISRSTLPTVNKIRKRSLKKLSACVTELIKACSKCFCCAKFNANEENLSIALSCVRFGARLVWHLKWVYM